MSSDDKQHHHREGQGLDSPPEKSSGQDVSGAGYVGDEEYKPLTAGEGLANPADGRSDGADISRERYVESHPDEGEHRR